MKIKDEAVKAMLTSWFGMDYEGNHMEEGRAALEAALPHLSQGAVRVKPLEWVRGWMNAEAQSAIGLYIITYRRDGSFDWHVGDHNGWASSWDEAKAAAQADYERRILSALSPVTVGVTDEMVEIVAKKIADFLGYAWKGLSTHSVVEQGCRMFTHGQFGWSFHGGQPDLRNVARDLLEAALASHEPAPTVANAELQQEVETLREGIKEIAEREQSIRDNWARYEESTKARILELEIDLEIANDKLEKMAEALEPFAEVAFDEHADLPDNTVVVIKHEKLLDVTFTLGDFRRARTTLGGKSNG